MKKTNIKWIRIFTIICFLVFVYSYSPYKLDFLGHYDKIWAHRANSINKLHSAIKYYKGVELDLVYDEEKDLLDVNHPPSKSVGLNFSDYILSMPNTNKVYLWLDIKNLKKENSDKILKKLLHIFKEKEYDLNKILIETRYPESLVNFTKLGFKTSYYLPFRLYKKDEKELEKEIYNIRKVLKSQPNIGISTNHKNYKIIAKYFPKQTKYIWDLVFTLNTNVFLTRKILNDKTVKVVLVNYKALKGNR